MYCWKNFLNKLILKKSANNKKHAKLPSMQKYKSLIEKTRFWLTFDVFVTHAGLSSPSDLIHMVINNALCQNIGMLEAT